MPKDIFSCWMFETIRVHSTKISKSIGSHCISKFTMTPRSVCMRHGRFSSVMFWYLNQLCMNKPINSGIFVARICAYTIWRKRFAFRSPARALAAGLPRQTWNHKVGLGISRTNADSQWNPVYKNLSVVLYTWSWPGKPAASARAGLRKANAKR